MNSGFLVMAQNTLHTDYVLCATMLAKNIKKIMPKASVSIVTDNKVNESVFDNVISLPYGDIDQTEWKLSNDWQVYEASPYEYTIKLESDMYLPRSVDWWWEILSKRELHICTTIRNYKSEISNSNFYRKTITNNKLPNTYNAITYFKRSELAHEFFSAVKEIFANWDNYKNLLMYCPDKIPTTDVVYALAARYIGEQYCTIPTFTDFSFVHMKQQINELISSVWHNELVYEILPETFRIASHTQLYPVHYHEKSFAKILERTLYEV